MKLHETSDGFIFSFGFDMTTRKPDAHLVCWCDPLSKEWAPRPSNRAGSVLLTKPFNPELIIEHRPGMLLAVAPGVVCEFIQIGFPNIWQMNFYTPEHAQVVLDSDKAA